MWLLEGVGREWFPPLRCATVVWIIATINWPDLWLYRYGLSLFTLSSSVIVLYLSAFPGGIASRCFSWKPLTYVGKRSYAIYLFHLPIFMFLTTIYKVPIGWKAAAIGSVPTLLLNGVVRFALWWTMTFAAQEPRIRRDEAETSTAS